MTKKKSNEIRISRFYEAPLGAVWDAWTDPAQVGQWWGPRGFTLTTHGKDLRRGGYWDYTMHGPDGTDYPNVTTYLEVEPQRKLVYDHGATRDTPPLFRVTALFTAVKGGTQLDLTMALPTPEAAAETRAFVRKAGGDATWDRLAEHLEKGQRGSEVFFINRSFEAPIQRVFDAWTVPEQLAQWLAPAGFRMTFARADIRPGGQSAYSMSSGDGRMTLHGRARYLEIEPPRRLVYEQEFTDAQGNLSRHPMAPLYPATIRTTIVFAEEGPDCTRVTVRWQATGAVTPAELDAFLQMRTGMTQGWTGSFDKLEAHLAGS